MIENLRCLQGLCHQWYSADIRSQSWRWWRRNYDSISCEVDEALSAMSKCLEHISTADVVLCRHPRRHGSLTDKRARSPSPMGPRKCLSHDGFPQDPAVRSR